MRIAGTVQESIVDGPGLRYVVFTQGCPHHCPGCHNPETHDPVGGTERPVEAIIKELLSNPLTDGVTLSGGEPFIQAGDCAAIAEVAKNAGLTVWVYSGYTFEELIISPDPAVLKLLRLTDVLVDGPFVLAERSLTLRWRGSKNQRLVDVTKSFEAGCAVTLD
ncbi:anaerobic ribonucleoside-triphosphate reductase activating protein [Oscillospiraceae bacterium CM]|nr:anaerobic ribonucleoside-triphosphate reductase activating protein [Oscillospiraceae bacterium CM]